MPESVHGGKAIDERPEGTEAVTGETVTAWSYPPHPAADLFPVLEGRDFEDFVAGLDEDGQLEPIVVYRDPEGQTWLLDGRNRDRALRRLGREPQVVEWSGECGSPSAFVIAKNLHRRHLDPGQRAALAVELLPMLRAEARERQRQAAIRTNAIRRERKAGRPIPAPAPGPRVRGEARAIAGDLFGASARSVSIAAALGARSPELLKQVKAGRLTLAEARRLADEADPAAAKRQGTGRRHGRHVRDLAAAVRCVEAVVEFLERADPELPVRDASGALEAARGLFDALRPPEDPVLPPQPRGGEAGSEAPRPS